MQSRGGAGAPGCAVNALPGSQEAGHGFAFTQAHAQVHTRGADINTMDAPEAARFEVGAPAQVAGRIVGSY